MQSDKLNEQPLDQFRDYLMVLARTRISPEARVDLDASDIVQETLLEAHQKLHQFRGTEAASLAAWLRKMLAFNIADRFRSLGRQKRDISKVESFSNALDASSSRLDDWIAASQSSPSSILQRQESMLELASAIEKLPEMQREAIRMRYIENMSVNDIAQRLDRSIAAVAGLLKRGLETLRETMGRTLP